MGDTHFLLRHAMVGVVVLLSVWLGWWFVQPDAAIHFIIRQKPEVASAVFSAVFTAPVIGITVQGMHIFGLWLFGKLFKDYARRVVADSMRDQFAGCIGSDPFLKDHHWDELRAAPADSLFVWLYHRSAPTDLIEWARRRRSYYYLGINLVIAAVLGLLAGAFLPTALRADPWHQRGAVLILFLAWAWGAIWAARRMLRDVDQMELLWAAARVSPALRECLEKTFGTLVHETFSGNDPVSRGPRDAPAAASARSAGPGRDGFEPKGPTAR
jgi:hypothetical protein